MPPDTVLPALIVGAGPIGLACALSAARRGLTPLVIDAGCIAHSIHRYPVGMTFFTTPERLEIGGHPFTCSGAKPTREEALKYYRGVVRADGIDVRTYTRLLGAERHGDLLHCQLVDAAGITEVRTRMLVLATGYFDHPNLLGVPGEELPHVSHWFDEAHPNAGRDVVIIGGKNSAIETALQCFRAGARVTLIYRGAAMRPSVKFWLRPDFENRVAAGEIAVRFESEVSAISPTTVAIRTRNSLEEHLPAQRVYALTGYHPDFDLLRSLGLVLDEDGRPALDAETLESNVPGIHVAGSAGAGMKISDVFIENGRLDGEKIFGGQAGSREAERRYHLSPRPVGE